MPIYRATSAGSWGTIAVWEIYSGSGTTWVAASVYPNTTSDVVYLNSYVITVDAAITTITTAEISNAANATIGVAAGGRLSLASVNSPATIKAATGFTYGSLTSAPATQGLIDASTRSGSFTFTIESTSIANLVAAPFFTTGASCITTVKGAAVNLSVSLSGGTSCKLYASTAAQNITLDGVNFTAGNAHVIDLTSASGTTMLLTNNCNIVGSSTATMATPIYAISFSSANSHTCTIEGGTITAGSGCPAINMPAATANIVKIQNDASAPNTSSAKIVNVNYINAITAARMQIDNNITGWDFQPVLTVGTTTLSPTGGTYPPAKHVLFGVSYNNGVTGILQQADAATVLKGTTYGVTSTTNDTPRTGTLDIPNAVAQVVGNIVANLT